jgi:antitoxin (DNA-binding transcriptional repressor) of toxin-antitoxin stability system
MTVKQISISEFKAHCAEEIRAVEKGELELKITRHGKVIAIARAPQATPTNVTFLGAGMNTAYLSSEYDPHAPAFAESDWA